MQNRTLLAEDTGKQLDFQWLTQVHGNTVLTLDKELVDEGAEADALYTRQKKIACGVLTADCLSVLFCDEKGEEIAVAHAGWRGLATGVLERTIAKFDAEPNTLLAYLGPVIGKSGMRSGRLSLIWIFPKSSTSIQFCFMKVRTPKMASINGWQIYMPSQK